MKISFLTFSLNSSFKWSSVKIWKIIGDGVNINDDFNALSASSSLTKKEYKITKKNIFFIVILYLSPQTTIVKCIGLSAYIFVFIKLNKIK